LSAAAQTKFEQTVPSSVDGAHTHIEDINMADHRIAGTAKNIGGKAQETFGSLTGNRSHEAKGKLNQAEGTLQDAYGQAKDAASDAAESVTRLASEAHDTVRQYIEDKPYTVAFAALAIGFIVGRMGRH
jgi:uncharacterized protein YjbJ (UPF0337 family)